MHGSVGSRNPRVLVAAIPEAYPRVERALAGFEVEFVANLSSAISAVRDRTFDFVVVGIDLAESSALDVVGEIRRMVPQLSVVCVRAVESEHRTTATTVHAFRLACAEIGACGVIDMFEFPDTLAGNAAIRNAIVRLRDGAVVDPERL
jgi:hypothetical protein